MRWRHRGNRGRNGCIKRLCAVITAMGMLGGAAGVGAR
jgi:hypothetical protein